MRQIGRIDGFLEKLGELWKKNPDLRFTQLCRWLEHMTPHGSFYFEEDKLETIIDILITQTDYLNQRYKNDDTKD